MFSKKIKEIRYNSRIFYVFLIFIFLRYYICYSQTISYNQWNPLPCEDLYGGQVYSLAVDPINSNIVYAGTNLGGVYKSEDGGTHWHEKNLGLTNLNIFCLAIHPYNSQIILAGTENGIYKSENSGESWAFWGLPNSQVNAIASDIDNNIDIIYAATGNLFTSRKSEKAIWRFDGNHWQKNQLLYLGAKADVYTIFIDSTDQEKRIYLGTSHGIWSSTDGLSWPETNHELEEYQVFALTVYRQNYKRLLAGTQVGLFCRWLAGKSWNYHQDKLKDKSISQLYVDSNDVLYVATKNYGLFKKSVIYHEADWEDTGAPITDIFSITIDKINTNNIYCSTLQGVYKSQDAGKNFSYTVSGIKNVKVDEMLINSLYSNEFYLTTDCGLFKSIDSGANWKRDCKLPNLKLIDLYANPFNPNTIYASLDSGLLYITYDRGNSWEKLNSPFYKKKLDINRLVLIQNESFNNIILAGTDSGIYKSIDDFNSWFQIDDLTESFISFSNTFLSCDTVYAGTKNGKIFRSINKTTTWENRSTGLPPYESINDIQVNPFNRHHLMAATSNGIYSSSNSGESWNQIRYSTFYAKNILKIYFDTSFKDLIYLLIENEGIWVSYDNGKKWENFNNNLLEYQSLINTFLLHPKEPQMVFAGTLGKGIYYFNAKSVLELEIKKLYFKQNVGSNAKDKITVINTGKYPLDINKIYSTDSSISFSEIERTIKPDQNQNIFITFSPDTIIKKIDNYLILNSNSLKNADSVVLVTEAMAAYLKSEISSHNFDKQVVGKTNNIEFEVKNNGNKEIDFNLQFDNPKGPFTAFPATNTLYSDSTQKVLIYFLPSSPDSFKDTLRIISNQVFWGTKKIFFSGIGTAGSCIYLSDTYHHFSTIKPNFKEFWDLIISNCGSEILNIDSISHQNTAFDFPQEFIPIPVNSNLILSIAFSPTEAGLYLDTLYIHSNSITGDSMIYLSGSCAENIPIIELNPDTLDFNKVSLYDSSSYDLYISNKGDQSWIINDIIVPKNISYRYTNTNIVQPDSSVKIQLTYSPRDTFCLNDSLEIIANEAIGHNKAYLFGMGVAPVIRMDSTINLGVTIIDTILTSNLIIQNFGNDTLNFYYELTGADANFFSISPISGIIEPGNSDTLILFFNTNNLNELREYSTRFLLKSNKFFYGDSIIFISSKIVTGPIINTEPNYHNYGIVKVGNETSKSFLVKNNGIGLLKINNVSIEGDIGNFVVQITDSSIKEKNNLNLNISFKPDTIKDFHARIIISSNAVLGDSIINVIGLGKAAYLSISDSIINFGDVDTDTDSINYIEIANNGNDSLFITNIEINQIGKVFSLGSSKFFPVFLSPLNKDTCYVKFSPDTIKKYPAEMYIYSNALDGTKKIHLEGYGRDLTRPQIISVSVNNEKCGVECDCYAVPLDSIVTISVVAKDNFSGIKNIRIHYREGGMYDYIYDQNLSFVCLDSFVTTIPKEYFTIRGIEFQIYAFDIAGNQSDSTKMYYSVPVFIKEEYSTWRDSLIVPVYQNVSNPKKATRLISFPWNLINPDPSKVLYDDLDYNQLNKKWWLADYKIPLEKYPECYTFLGIDEKHIYKFEPGKSFFIFLTEPYITIDSGPGRTIHTNKPFFINLKTGWNLISNPFPFSIPLNQLRLKSNDRLTIWAVNKDWYYLEGDQEKINPWDGYVVFSDKEYDTLFVFPSPNIDNSITNHPKRNLTNNIQPLIQIIAQCGNACDSLNFIGLSPFADDEYDDNDLPESPANGNFVKLYFFMNDSCVICRTFTKNIKSSQNDGKRWDFGVFTNIKNSEVNIRFKNVENLKINDKFILQDKNINIVHDIRQNQLYKFWSADSLRERRFSIFLGDNDYIHKNIDPIKIKPLKNQSFQNFPNPFNSYTTILFNLAETQIITLKIYNLKGQLVKTLLEEMLISPGTRSFYWDGTDNYDNTVASGIYIYRIESNVMNQSRRLIYLR